MPIRFSREAEEDIIQIYLSGLASYGELQTERYMSGLDVIWTLLEANPALAHERIEYQPAIRIHPYKAHVIVYRADEDGVFILRVRRGAEDWVINPVDANDQ